MKLTTITGLLAGLTLMTSGTVLAEGHCNYTQYNMHTPQPYKVCTMPADEAQCEQLGKTDDNSDAVYGDGACDMEKAVGYCDRGEDGKLVYYEGDPGGLEIGCGFQGGEWVGND